MVRVSESRVTIRVGDQADDFNVNDATPKI